MVKKYLPSVIVATVYLVFIVCSFSFDIEAGKRTAADLLSFLKQMLLLLPFAFVCIGLFEVWVKRETVERHLGRSTGFTAYLLAVILAGTTVGGLYVAFPFAAALHTKGARAGVIFTYLSCAGICRIPMTVFEASFLGVKFTLVRFAVSLPLVVASSWLMEKLFEKTCFQMNEQL
jgi:uncharacterized membrane protein YraQ (UPF0718 family)